MVQGAVILIIIFMIISYFVFKQMKSSKGLDQLRASSGGSRIQFCGKEFIAEASPGVDGTNVRVLLLLGFAPKLPIKIARGQANAGSHGPGMTVSTDAKKSFSIIHPASLNTSLLTQGEISAKFSAIFGKPRMVQNFYYNKPEMFVDRNMLVFIANTKAKVSEQKMKEIFEIMGAVSDLLHQA